LKNERKNSDYLIAAEFRFLNGLISNPDWLNDSRVYVDALFHDTAKAIFTAIENNIKLGHTISEAGLFQSANEIDYNVNKETITYIFGLENENPNLDDLLRVLRKGTQKFTFKSILEDITEHINSHEDLDVSLVSNLVSDMTRVVNDSFDKSLMKSMKDWSDVYSEELKSRLSGKSYLFGDLHLDKALPRKAAPGQVILLAGATGSGKSTYALGLVNGFINLNIPSIYISLEMDEIASYDRLLAQRVNIPVNEMYNSGDALLPIIKSFEEERKDLDKASNFYFVEEPNLSIIHIHSIIREFKQRTGNNYAIVIIDLLTMVKEFQETAGGLNLANAIESGMNKVNAIAKEENVCILGVVQFNRQADSLKVNSIDELEMLRPQINHIKNAHALAERSRVVISAFRPKYYAVRMLPDSPEVEDMEDIMECQIIKNSQGQVGQIMRYLFEGDVFRLTPIEKED
jgi:replicative DNA helicase